MRNWFAHLLVAVLVVTGTFVAIASGCQSGLRVATGGGSCSETHFAPLIPFADADGAVAPFERFDVLALLVVVLVLSVPRVPRSAPTNLLGRSYGIPRRIQLALRD